MGHFEKDDLLDVFRHEMRLEDEDGPGLCKSLLFNPKRRAKYGGLPLDFRKISNSEEDLNNFDENFEIPLYEEPLHTRTIINEKLDERTEERMKEEQRGEGKIYKGDLNELFIKKHVEWPVKETDTPQKSAIDIYLENNAGCLNNKLGSYLQFSASPNVPSKDILIIFPVQNSSKQNDFRSIKISVTCSARVREVVGYSMMQYFLTFGESLEGDVDDYQFYLAEDDGEIEKDFPPLDSSKIIGQLGFECLGLVHRRETSGGRNTKHVIIVYFLDKDHYAIEVDNMEKSLKWLRDEALRLREQNVKEEPYEGLTKIKDYYLETIDHFDVKLDLEATIASTRCQEFVMIRKNSSRAGFHPRGARYGRQMSAMLTLKMPNSPIPAAPITPLPTVVEMNSAGGVAENPFDFSSPTVKWSEEGQLSSFTVMRTHRFKPKWKATLFIRWTCFEIDKFSIDRSAFLPQGYQKKTKVNWEYVGGLRVQKKDNKPGRADTWQLSIHWLPPLDDEVIQKVVGDEEWNLRHVLSLYEHEEKWRSVTIESTNNNDVEAMESQIMSILHARDAAIYRAFNHSSYGYRAPAASAELAMMDSSEGPILTPIDTSTSSKHPGKMRKMSKLIIKPITNAARKTINN